MTKVLTDDVVCITDAADEIEWLAELRLLAETPLLPRRQIVTLKLFTSRRNWN